MQKPVNPQLMIIDCAMPGINGAEVAMAARAAQATLPILFVSGHVDAAALEDAMGSAPFLRKPFRPIDLAAAVKATINENSTVQP